jgi:NADPH:quinone reductase-like Zn-dependent oxidoreductase
MQAVVMREFGEPSVMKVETISRPVSEKGKCVIQLHACGVNPVERIFFLIIY